MKKDMATLIGGFLTALFFFFGTIGISFEWFTQDSINAFVVLISAGIALSINLYAVYKNTYALTKKAKLQKELLERHNLK